MSDLIHETEGDCLRRTTPQPAGVESLGGFTQSDKKNIGSKSGEKNHSTQVTHVLKLSAAD
jgi:hypothetical protein